MLCRSCARRWSPAIGLLLSVKRWPYRRSVSLNNLAGLTPLYPDHNHLIHGNEFQLNNQGNAVVNGQHDNAPPPPENFPDPGPIPAGLPHPQHTHEISHSIPASFSAHWNRKTMDQPLSQCSWSRQQFSSPPAGGTPPGGGPGGPGLGQGGSNPGGAGVARVDLRLRNGAVPGFPIL